MNVSCFFEQDEFQFLNWIPKIKKQMSGKPYKNEQAASSVPPHFLHCMEHFFACACQTVEWQVQRRRKGEELFRSLAGFQDCFMCKLGKPGRPRADRLGLN